MESDYKIMAKLALKRLTSGFWQDEKNQRKKTLAILQNQGADTVAAKKVMLDNTKQKIAAAVNQEDEQMYLKVKEIFLSGNAENALAVLIDQTKIKSMDDSARQRYIFNLSAKLAEFRERFEKEKLYQCQEISC